MSYLEFLNNLLLRLLLVLSHSATHPKLRRYHGALVSLQFVADFQYILVAGIRCTSQSDPHPG